MKKKGKALKLKKRDKLRIKQRKISPRYKIPFKKRSCSLCKVLGKPRSSGGLSVHHIIPRYEGGTNHPKNLIVVCKIHHKHIHHPHLYNKTKRAYQKLLKAKDK